MVWAGVEGGSRLGLASDLIDAALLAIADDGVKAGALPLTSHVITHAHPDHQVRGGRGLLLGVWGGQGGRWKRGDDGKAIGFHT